MFLPSINERPNPMRPAHEPTETTRAQVLALSQYLTQRDVALFLDIDQKTLRKHYRDELDKGAVRANSKVLQNLYAYASGSKGSERAQITAAIFWGKTRCGLSEKVSVQNLDRNGEPVDAPAAVDLTKLSHDHLLALLAVSGQLERAGVAAHPGGDTRH
jgi:hypothetical protein